MSSRKPLAEHTGHHTKAELARLEAENEAATATRKCFDGPPPNELIDENAKKEWARITDILKDMEIIGDLDLFSLIGYCNAFSLYVKTTNELKTAPLTVDGAGGLKQNPLVRIQDLYAKQMRDMAMKCGLSIDYRLKCAAMKVNKEDDEVEDMFGDI